MISLHLDRLSKSYGQKSVLNEVSLTHKEGVLGISGPNGSGKSTLLKCLGRLLRPSSGTISWKSGGEPLSEHEVERKLGYTAPYISLYKELTISENLQFLQKIRSDDPGESLSDIIALTGLENISEQTFGSLSTGQKQRAKLAAALFHNPEILLLDEPGAGLDEEGRSLVTQIVDKVRKENKLLILASNLPAELELCDRIYSVNTGKEVVVE